MPAGAGSRPASSPRASARVRELGADGPLAAAIGPGAGPCCYEVGEEVHAAFARRRRRRSADGRNLDLKAIARVAAGARGSRRGPRRRAVHDLLGPVAVLLAPPRSRRHGPPGGDRVAELIRGLRRRRGCAATSRACARRSRTPRRRPERGRDPRRGQVRPGRGARRRWPRRESLLVGENRAQDLAAKADALPRPVHVGLHRPSPEPQGRTDPAVRPLHPFGGERLGAGAARRHGDADTEVLVEVNVAGEPGKSGIAPDALPAFLDRCPVPVVGLMTMPPLSRTIRRPAGRYFAALRELADAPRPRPAVDGDQPGLPGRCAGGRDDRAPWHEPLLLGRPPGAS